MKKIIVVLLMVICITGCGEKKEELKSEGFTLSYQNTSFTLGELFDVNKYGTEYTYSETESCAFEDKDRIYTYEDYEVTTYTLNNEERVLSIYFLNPNMKTTEGLSIGDTIQKMQELYGTDYEQDANLYTYKKDHTNLKIIVEDEIVKSIEYYNIVE